MSFQYRQNPPEMSRDGSVLPHVTLYSGYGAAKNDPAMEAVAGNGPIPRGMWKIVRWDDHHGDKGPIVAVLEPVGHDAHGRTNFLEHGDSVLSPGNASHGCIIADRALREAMRAFGDDELEVV